MQRIAVLDQGWVELEEVMGSDLAIVNGARTSFLGESKGEEADKRLLMRLYKDRHTSPFELGVMRFRLHAPLVVWWQLVRHRTGSFSLQSGRYTEYNEDAFYIPAIWRLQSKSNKQASEGELEPVAASLLTEQLTAHYEAGYKLYEQALAQGVAREQARLFLGAFGVYGLGVIKFDVHNLTHMLRLRLAKDAQWEIRQYALAIDQYFASKFPWCHEAMHSSFTQGS